MRSNCYNATVWKSFPTSTESLLHSYLLKISWVSLCGAISLSSNLFHWSMCLSSTRSIQFDYYNCIIILKIGQTYSLHFTLPFFNLTTLFPFSLCILFWNNFFYVCKKNLALNLIGIALNLYIDLGRIDLFIMWSLLVFELVFLSNYL